MIRSSYTPAQIADAIARAQRTTGWPGGMMIHDMAAHMLAGPQASDEAIERAAKQIVDYQAGADG